MKKSKKIFIAILGIISIPIIAYKMVDMNYKENHIKLKRNIKILPQLFPTVETLISSIKSPDDKYTLNLYLNSGNATVDFSVRGELENKFGMKKNIYQNYHEKECIAEFKDNDTVEINGETLNIHRDKFDWRDK